MVHDKYIQNNNNNNNNNKKNNNNNNNIKSLLYRNQSKVLKCTSTKLTPVCLITTLILFVSILSTLYCYRVILLYELGQQQQQQHTDNEQQQQHVQRTLFVTSTHRLNEQQQQQQQSLSYLTTSSIMTENTSNNNKRYNETTTTTTILDSHDVLSLKKKKTTTTIHEHVIPNHIFFTYKLNLVTTNFSYRNNNNNHHHHSHDTSSLTAEQKEVLALQDNVHNIIKLYPTSTVHFLTDNDCIDSIRRVMPTIIINNNTNNNTSNTDIAVEEEMVSYFRNESTGMYKGDICRGVALYEYGGLYMDVDLGVRINVFTTNVLNKQTEFVTVQVHSQSKHPGSFFQAFIGVTQYHPVIQRYIYLFYQYYKGILYNKHSIDGRPLGVVLLKRAYDEILQEQQIDLNVATATTTTTNRKKRMLDEFDGELQSLQQSKTTTTIPTMTHLQQTSEIWEEILYSSSALKERMDYIVKTVPYPKWGIRRACKFIVVTKKDDKDVVPFYSRIAGSRICPTKEDILLLMKNMTKTNIKTKTKTKRTSTKKKHHFRAIKRELPASVNKR